MIAQFVNQFGVITDIELNKLNKTLSIQLVDGDEKGNAVAAGTNLDKKTDNNDMNSIEKLTLMIRDMSKYSILIGIASITSSCVMIWSILSAIFQSDILMNLLSPIILLDGIINIICLSFQFYFFKSKYNKYCGILRRCCESRYTRKINSNLSKQASIASKNNSSFLQLKKLDRQGTVGIERVLSKDASRSNVLTNTGNPNVGGNVQESNSLATDRNDKQSTVDVIMNEPNLAVNNMNSFSEAHLE